MRSLGFVALTFASAQDFLQSPGLEETACLILDVQMPGMSGVDLQDVLLKRGHRIPIIFITAFPEDKVRDRVLRAGAVSFLVKPFDGRKMIDSLHVALQKNNGRSRQVIAGYVETSLVGIPLGYPRQEMGRWRTATGPYACIRSGDARGGKGAARP